MHLSILITLKKFHKYIYSKRVLLLTNAMVGLSRSCRTQESSVTGTSAFPKDRTRSSPVPVALLERLARLNIHVSTVTSTLLLGPQTMLLLTMVGLQTFPWLSCYFSAEWACSFLAFPRLCNGYKTIQHTFTLWVWIPVLCPTWLELLPPFSLWRKLNTETLQLSPSSYLILVGSKIKTHVS